MVKIICEPNQRQEIIDRLYEIFMSYEAEWDDEEDDEDYDEEEYEEEDAGSDEESDWFELDEEIIIKKVDNGLVIECDYDETMPFDYRLDPRDDLPDLFRKLKKQFPDIRIEGDYQITGKYAKVYYGVFSLPKEEEVEFPILYNCAVCGAKTDISKHDPFFVCQDNECICSPKCACSAVLSEADDGYGYTMDNILESFISKLPSCAGEVLTGKNVIPLLELLEREDVKRRLKAEELLAAKAVLLEYANMFGLDAE